MPLPETAPLTAIQPRRIGLAFLYALTLFLAASLLFSVQPLVGKMILPLLGGSPSVWNTCMLFFQGALLAGYAYAHASTAWLGVRRQALVHSVLLVFPAGISAPGTIPESRARPAEV